MNWTTSEQKHFEQYLENLLYRYKDDPREKTIKALSDMVKYLINGQVEENNRPDEISVQEKIQTLQNSEELKQFGKLKIIQQNENSDKLIIIPQVHGPMPQCEEVQNEILKIWQYLADNGICTTFLHEGFYERELTADSVLVFSSAYTDIDMLYNYPIKTLLDFEKEYGTTAVSYGLEDEEAHKNAINARDEFFLVALGQLDHTLFPMERSNLLQILSPDSLEVKKQSKEVQDLLFSIESADTKVLNRKIDALIPAKDTITFIEYLQVIKTFNKTLKNLSYDERNDVFPNSIESAHVNNQTNASTSTVGNGHTDDLLLEIAHKNTSSTAIITITPVSLEE